MEEIPLGKLERGWLRDLWKREDTHFTPWLAQEVNIALLAEALGLDQLEEIQTEYQVGDFRLDILARDPQSGTLVAIENQFWTGDHKHFGQLITYAAGVSGESSSRKLFVWIAEDIKEEHRSALDWLNRVTDPNLGFFGIVLELWKIGDSPFAPRFNVVSRPNDWQKKVSEEASALSPTELLYQDFWNGFIDFCESQKTRLQFTDGTKKYSWIPTEIGIPGFGVNLNAVKRSKRLECHLWISFKRSKEAFRMLLQEKDKIIASLGAQTMFDEMPDRVACKIFETSTGDINDREQWPDMYRWLKERGEAYVATFTPLIKDLRLG